MTKQNMTGRELLRMASKIAHVWGCPLSELRGSTIRSILSDLDSAEHPVYWGTFTTADLDYVVGEN